MSDTSGADWSATIATAEKIGLHISTAGRIYSLVVNDDLRFQVFTKPPRWWWRLWQYLLLGWRWKGLEEP